MSKSLALALTIAIGVIVFAGVSHATGTDTTSGQTAQEPLSREFGSWPTNVVVERDSGNPDTGASLPSTNSGTPSGTAKAGSQAASLPFTGFLAIPVLLAGMALLGFGIVSRRRSTQPQGA